MARLVLYQQPGAPAPAAAAAAPPSPAAAPHVHQWLLALDRLLPTLARMQAEVDAENLRLQIKKRARSGGGGGRTTPNEVKLQLPDGRLVLASGEVVTPQPAVQVVREIQSGRSAARVLDRVHRVR